MVKRIGLSMRIATAKGYNEPRDCLAQDWHAFMKFAFPECLWMPIPNIGSEVADWLAAWEIDAVILTGGNDIGEFPLRDETEKAILTRALARDLPVIGVCRGFQMIQHYFGGRLVKIEGGGHVGKDHSVRFVPSESFPFLSEEKDLSVNSFHSWGVEATQLASGLRLLAQSSDGLAEALFHEGKRVTAIQWHPERRTKFSDVDRLLVRRTIGYERTGSV